MFGPIRKGQRPNHCQQFWVTKHRTLNMLNKLRIFEILVQMKLVYIIQFEEVIGFGTLPYSGHFELYSGRHL